MRGELSLGSGAFLGSRGWLDREGSGEPLYERADLGPVAVKLTKQISAHHQKTFF